MTPFDVINAPLKGIQLIDASAGTGKTYTISSLYIRLVLEKKWSVDQILVVTYTRAATAELKERILRRLRDTRQALQNGGGSDPLINAIVKKQHHRSEAISRIDAAIVGFDQAAIFTIHGFCQRVLHDHAFRTGIAYETNLVTNPLPVIEQVAQDFWRTQLYTAAPELIAHLNQKERIDSPQYLTDFLVQLPPTDVEIFPEMAKPELTALSAYRDLIHRLKTSWRKFRKDIRTLLLQAPLKGNIYGSKQVTKTGLTKREVMVTAMLADMDRFLFRQQIAYPLFERFEKFTAAKLDRFVKKNHRPPQHDLFDLCDQLADAADRLAAEMARFVLYLKTELVAYARDMLAKRKQQDHIFFYDDLLTAVRDTLMRDSAAEKSGLAGILRDQYRAALVDEFQDTDAIQYDIFAQVFSAHGVLFFMIGDPKQSIYSFRGADIYTYLKVSQSVDRKATLTHNWRSSPALISAVNALFSNVNTPFLLKQIPFEPARPASGRHHATEPATTGLHLWYLLPEDAHPITKADATRRILKAVVAEVVRLGCGPQAATAFEDMAVLVRTNRQAHLVKDALTQKGISAVIHSTGNVFESDEAEQLERLLKGILEPTNENRFRAALAGYLTGIDATRLFGTEGGSRLLDQWRRRFHRYHQIWKISGFARMFYQLLAEADIRQHLLVLPNGERRLTNLLHLLEILHQESIMQKWSMTGLLQWLSDQVHGEGFPTEEHLLRLESDASAVQIVTIHKSKGLEYPVVFCPFAWEGIKLKKTHPVYFHEANAHHRLMLDLGSDQIDRSRTAARQEMLAESLRLLYVAVTRAKKSCYLVWGRINGAETSPLAHLLFGIQTDPDEDAVTCLKTRLAGYSDADYQSRLDRLVGASNGTIALHPLPEQDPVRIHPQPNDAQPLTHRSLTSPVTKPWHITSYSALVSARFDNDATEFDADARPTITDFENFKETWLAPQASVPEHMHTFPRGTKAGLFVHDLFEHLDFSNFEPSYRDQLIQSKLTAYGFAPTWKKAVRHMLDQVLTTPLNPDQNDLCLSGLTWSQRINEMEFYFPIAPIKAGAAEKKRQRTVAKQPFVNPSPSPLERLAVVPQKGFMRGFIDLVFEYQGGYFLLDWKSNYLGARVEDYHSKALNQTMVEADYFLQAQIYTLALHLYLKKRKPNYRFETDIRGVYYLFVRGMGTRRGHRYGIFEYHPTQNEIMALAHGLGLDEP